MSMNDDGAAPPPGDRLEALLRRAVETTGDELVREWFRRLLEGDAGRAGGPLPGGQVERQ